MEEFEERKKKFLEAYEKIVTEFKCDVGSAPQYIAIGGGAFATMLIKEVIDMSKVGVKSPFTEAK